MTTVTVTATKEPGTETIGLSLNYYDGGKIIIRNIFPDGLFADTDIKAGFVLVSVNGTECKGLSTAQAMALFTDVTEGEITVVAEDVGLRVASFTKSASNSKVGIGLKSRNGSLIVSSIAPDGLLASTDIHVGQSLLGVNGTSCKGLSTKEAIALFKQLEGLTILTQDIGLISVTVQRENLQQKIGIGLKEINGNIIISTIASDGLFAGTALKPGLRLLRVGTTDCEKLNKHDAILLFKNAEGSLTVLADDVGLIAVTVKKESAEDKVGIALNEIQGKIIISSISEDSLFAGTDLEVGLRLVCVGTTLTQGLSKVEAIKLFKNAKGEFTVLAEKVGLICAKATKESVDSSVGVGLKNLNGSVIVSSIAPGSIFAETPLKVGHKLVSVNKASCLTIDKMDAIGLFKKAEGEVTVMAEDIGVIGATIVKPSVDSKLGIGKLESLFVRHGQCMMRTLTNCVALLC
jgi:C-terminal processing protease CtpA/Prc